MKLEVGMYCYDKSNRKLGIGKIIEFRKNNNAVIEYRSGVVLISVGNIIASHNLIDLIEVGDYVNGYKIEEVNNNLNEHKGICNCLDTYLWCVNELDKFEEIEIFENDIKSVVTKEQFNSMKYEVGE